MLDSLERRHHIKRQHARQHRRGFSLDIVVARDEDLSPRKQRSPGEGWSMSSVFDRLGARGERIIEYAFHHDQRALWVDDGGGHLVYSVARVMTVAAPIHKIESSAASGRC